MGGNFALACAMAPFGLLPAIGTALTCAATTITVTQSRIQRRVRSARDVRRHSATISTIARAMTASITPISCVRTASTKWKAVVFVESDACRTHVCFIPVERACSLRFNRYRFIFLYDPLETFGEMSGN